MYSFWRLNFTFFITLCVLRLTSGSNDVIRIGGLFLRGDSQEIAFHNAISTINNDPTILPGSKLTAKVETLSSMDSFQASKSVCNILSSGVAAIIDPQSAEIGSHVQSICNAMEIPHLATRWDYKPKSTSFSINLYPHSSSLSKAYVELVRHLGWKSFTIIYETNDGLARLQQLLNADFDISLRQLLDSDDNRSLLKQIKKSGVSNIILDCNSAEKIYEILKQAQQVGLMGADYSYLITSLDLHIINLDEFKHSLTNIMGFRLIDPENSHVQNYISNLTTRDESGELNKIFEIDNAFKISTDIALIYDAVHLLAKALHNFGNYRQIETIPLTCDGNNTWSLGHDLIQYMQSVEMVGLSGNIKFDNQGLRTNFMLDIIELEPYNTGLSKVGTWGYINGINFNRLNDQIDIKDNEIDGLKNRNIFVTAVLTSPYCMLKETSETLIGNDRYEGYGVDLIHEISQMLNFNYTIALVPDGRYGAFDIRAGKWNGMIQEVLEGRADLTLGDLTITSERQQALDFVPFMNLGIGMLYHKPMIQSPNLLSFLSPLSIEVWLYTVVAYIVVSCLLFILARFSPYEEDNPNPNSDVNHMENQFTFCNSLWFAIGGLLQQGSGVVPKSISTRVAATVWWFFALIMICSYTANLATFLMTEHVISSINDVADLIKQRNIKYGVKYGGSTQQFFRDSEFPIYQQMWSVMTSQPLDVFTNTNIEGVDRVSKSAGQYAFFMESTAIEYIVARSCNLVQVGGLLDSKQYGIGIAKGSNLHHEISSSVLRLQEKGMLQRLKTKWWSERRIGEPCQGDSIQLDELSLSNMSGLFVVLILGLGIACLIAVCELVCKSRKAAIRKKTSLRSEMISGLSLIFKCCGNKTHKSKARSADNEDSPGTATKYVFDTNEPI